MCCGPELTVQQNKRLNIIIIKKSLKIKVFQKHKKNIKI
jgi:hypothetical protein